VHQSCYGGNLLSKQINYNWICESCTHHLKKPQEDIKCRFCLKKNVGALKILKTEDGKQLLWGHVQCVNWIPELRFYDNSKTRIDNILNEVLNKRSDIMCRLCGLKEGVVIQCDYKDCSKSYHVTCAQLSNIIRPWKSMSKYVNSNNFIPIYCNKHRRYVKSTLYNDNNFHKDLYLLEDNNTHIYNELHNVDYSHKDQGLCRANQLHKDDKLCRTNDLSREREVLGNNGANLEERSLMKGMSDKNSECSSKNNKDKVGKCKKNIVCKEYLTKNNIDKKDILVIDSPDNTLHTKFNDNSKFKNTIECETLWNDYSEHKSKHTDSKDQSITNTKENKNLVYAWLPIVAKALELPQSYYITKKELLESFKKIAIERGILKNGIFFVHKVPEFRELVNYDYISIEPLYKILNAYIFELKAEPTKVNSTKTNDQMFNPTNIFNAIMNETSCNNSHKDNFNSQDTKLNNRDIINSKERKGDSIKEMIIISTELNKRSSVIGVNNVMNVESKDKSNNVNGEKMTDTVNDKWINKKEIVQVEDDKTFSNTDEYIQLRENVSKRSSAKRYKKYKGRNCDLMRGIISKMKRKNIALKDLSVLIDKAIDNI